MSSNKKIKPLLIEELPVFLEQTNLSTDEKNKADPFFIRLANVLKR